MATIPQTCDATAEWQQTLVGDLKRLRVFGDAPESELACFAAEAKDCQVAADELIVDEHEHTNDFKVLLDGHVRISKSNEKGDYFVKKVAAPSFLGEISLLANTESHMTVRSETPLHYAQLSEDSFWSVMARCPGIRGAILAEMNFRIRGVQAHQSQQEKLAMLGTMTAGLMHELNNPGAAARRAASQLRSNLQRMHKLARQFSEHGHTTEQSACLTMLQERALSVRTDLCMSSLQQADAEEELGAWMDERGIDRAWDFAPVLVSSGIGVTDLDCLARVFPAADLEEPLEWLEATASSMQMVGLVEDSVARVAELAQAVKSYAHEGQGGVQDLDVNESVHATVIMLKHKLREHNISLSKEFGPGIPKLHCVCSGLNQIWTNLLDNAIDAAGSGGKIRIRTAFDNGEVQVAIEDNGPGISQENQERIFDPFFTTKPLGVGTGLGLGIVKRIIDSYDGRISVDSHPGRTEFVVHIPAAANQTAR